MTAEGPSVAPDLPGLHTEGDSLQESTANAEEALALYIGGLRDEGGSLERGIIRRTLAGILRDAGIERDELRRLL